MYGGPGCRTLSGQPLSLALGIVPAPVVRDNRRLLADLKQHLKQQPPRKRAAVSAAKAETEDAAALFRQAVADTQPLAASQQAQIETPRPLPVPRPKAPDSAPAPKPTKRDDWLPASWLNDDVPPAPTGDAGVLAEALRGVKPIITDRIFPEAPKPAPLPIQHERDERAALVESIYAPTSLELNLEGGDELVYLCNGVPRSILRDLRRGRWVVEEEVDLHGCNRDEARELLAACMAQWRRKTTRCVRVIHGKGRGSPRKAPVLKRLVAGWLMNYEEVAAYCQARLIDGGAGALIVLLKAPRPAAKSGSPTP